MDNTKKKFRCIALTVSGKNNMIFRNTDKTPFLGSQVDNIDALIKGGYIEEVVEKKEVKADVKSATAKKK